MYDIEIYILKIENYLVFVVYMWFDVVCWIIYIYVFVVYVLDKKNIKIICYWIYVYKFYLVYWWCFILECNIILKLCVMVYLRKENISNFMKILMIGINFF